MYKVQTSRHNPNTFQPNYLVPAVCVQCAVCVPAFVKETDLHGLFYFLDNTLNQCLTDLNLKKFKFDCNYSSLVNVDFKSRVNSWIRYAISRNVKEVHLSLWDVGVVGQGWFTFKDELFFNTSCITRMSMCVCRFNPPNGAISWERLECLRLFCVILDEDIIEKILSGSPCLESLVLIGCYGYRRMDVTSKSVKKLVFDGHYPDEKYSCIKSYEEDYIDCGLECEVTLQELKTAVWDCGMDKSPGPDGFTFGFYRHFWSTIEEDVFGAVKHFCTHGDIPKGCNSSFVALISKVPDANLVNDFRPISLIRSIYKVIAKILANRLVGVLGIIVNEVQSAFIEGRQILDGPFILNEVMQWCKIKKKQSLVFKVDFEKAYDSVRWDFLDDVLKKFGFGNKWCNWIQECLRSSRVSILVNSSPTEE
ncbi:RNA-directed DNA polymerase, eukaryota, partial [Tanacetum coccineum]